MRLRKLYEEISKTDFFDLYTLLYFSTDEKYRNNHEVQRLTEFYVNYVWKDLTDQLTNRVVERFGDVGEDFGVPDVNWLQYKDQDTLKLMYGQWAKNIAELPQATKLKYLKHLVDNKISGGGFAGETWRSIAAECLRSSTASNHKQRVLAVDRLMGLLHHGGQITDHLDERKWLAQALNYRDNANPLQLAKYASSQVRQLIGRSAFIGMGQEPVSPLRMLATAIRRASVNHPNTEVIVNEPHITIKVDGTFYGPPMHNTPDSSAGSFHAGGKLPEFISKFGYVQIGEGHGEITGTLNHDAIDFYDLYNNQKSAKLPISDYYNTAYEITKWLRGTAAGEKQAREWGKL